MQLIGYHNPTGGHVRDRDAHGSGHFGASRAGGTRSHAGTDYVGTGGQGVRAVRSGTVTNIGYPYGDDLSFRTVDIQSFGGEQIRQFYVAPVDGLVAGSPVLGGQMIGTLQGLTGRYPGITNHVHTEIRQDGEVKNPETLIPPQ